LKEKLLQEEFMLPVLFGLAAGFVIGHKITKIVTPKQKEVNSIDGHLDGLVKIADAKRKKITREFRQTRLRMSLDNLIKKHMVVVPEDNETTMQMLKDLSSTVEQMRRDLYQGRNDTPRKPKNQDIA
jgi:uncharacterized membrane-anchored protein YhcB (DUF1043 family)